MKVFEKVEFNDTFEVGNDFISVIMSYAIPKAVQDIDSYWRTEGAEKVITDETFGFIWTNYADTREELLDVAHSVCSSNTRIKSLTKDFCKSFLSDLYALIEENEDLGLNGLRIRLLPVVDPNFDYLSRMCKFALDAEKKQLYDLWSCAGMSASKDSAFFDYLWSKVKRQKGSVNVKLRILEAAFENDAISDVLLKKIAKSSPKNIKRTATHNLSRKIQNRKRDVKRYKRSDDLKMAAFMQEKVDTLERKVMLFVDCIDRDVVSNLFDCLSKDNLPWLMPAASHHYWLAQRLQSRLDSNTE